MRSLLQTAKASWKAFRRLPRQQRIRILCATTVLIFAAWIGLRTEPPPSDAGDLCTIFAEKPSWWRSARRAAVRWDVPEAVQMAFLVRESGFQARARPPREKLWGWFPWKRPTSAFGYAQAIDATWDQYRASAGRPRAQRDHFDDAADFVGWYVDHLRGITGRSDVRHLYLAYYYGPAGYQQGRWKKEGKVVDYADQVAQSAEQYRKQYESCSDGLWWRHTLTRCAQITALLVALALGFKILRRNRA